jgi:hypothetical protein
MSGADGASLGAVNIEVDGSSPRPGDDIEGSICDLVMRGAGIGVPGSATPGDVTPVLGSSGAAGPGISGLLLSVCSNFPPLPINWRRVGHNVEFTSS